MSVLLALVFLILGGGAGSLGAVPVLACTRALLCERRKRGEPYTSPTWGVKLGGTGPGPNLGLPHAVTSGWSWSWSWSWSGGGQWSSQDPGEAQELTTLSA